MLNARAIRVVMRCDNNNGWSAARTFLRSAAAEARVTLSAPSASDVRDWGCPAVAPQARLVRQIAPNGQVRALVTNLDATRFPAALFADLYHQRWRIEEAFKRVKHRLHLEAVSGLSQQALIIDFAAKILADNLTSLICASASEQADLPARSRTCNRSYAAGLMQRLLPRLVLFIGDVYEVVTEAIAMLGATSQRIVSGRFRPRPAHQVKPHPSAAYKG